MLYEVHFDIAGFVVSAILVYVFFTYKNFPTWRSKIFEYLLLTILCSSLLDTVTSYTISYWPHELVKWNMILNIANILTVNATPFIYYIYIISMSMTLDKLMRMNWVPFIILAIYEFISIVTTYWTHFVLYFTEDNQYCHGPGMAILYIIGAFLMILGFIKISFQYKKIDHAQRSVAVFYTISTICAMIFQYFNPRMLLTSFASSVTLLLTYLTLQNPLEFYDSSTGACNRNAFDEIVSQKINLNKHFSLIAIQLKGIKIINSRFGLKVGNEIIKQFVDYIASLLPGIHAFRISGLFFTVLTDNESEAVEKADLLAKKLQQPFYLKNSASGIRYQISAYISILKNPLKMHLQEDPDARVTLDDIFKTAEYSVSEAPERGINQVLIVDDTVLAEKHKESMIQQIVEEAIDKESFEVFYQPIYNLHTKKFSSAEALIRLKDPATGRYIPPMAFIPKAEKNGEILIIGEIMLKKTCRFIQESGMLTMGIDTIHVNLSIVQCMQDNIAERLTEILDSYKIPYNRILFEITETTMAEDGDRLMKMMNKMAEQGIRFALDDYGTGYSNTANIMQYHYAIVKLDKSLIPIKSTETTRIISLKYMIGMIREMGMTVLAEGIESMGQSELLEKIDCDLIQGYYYAHPVNGTEFIELVKQKNLPQQD